MWLFVQWRRGRDTHRIALEAHEWARERREADQKRAASDEGRSKWLREMADRVNKEPYGVDQPPDIDPAWIAEGEEKGYFRRDWRQPGKWVFLKPLVKR